MNIHYKRKKKKQYFPFLFLLSFSGIKDLDEYSTLPYCPDSKLPFKLEQSQSSAFCAFASNFPQGKLTRVPSNSAQTQTTGPQTQVQQAQTQTAEIGGPETNGHAE